MEILLLTHNGIDVLINTELFGTAECDGLGGSRIILKDQRCLLVDQNPREIFEIVHGAKVYTPRG